MKVKNVEIKEELIPHIKFMIAEKIDRLTFAIANMEHMQTEKLAYNMGNLKHEIRREQALLLKFQLLKGTL